MRRITLTENELIQLIEAEITTINKNDLTRTDWDAERIVNSLKRGKDMYIKTKGGYLKQVNRKSGQTKTYFLTKSDVDDANNLIKEINKLKSKLDSILK
jgi:hypothetical protein